MERNGDGDYVRLEDEEDIDGGTSNAAPPDVPTSSETWWRWGVKEIGLCILTGIATVILIKWLGPPFMHKVVIPTLNWVTRSFDPPTLAFLIFASTALFPALMVPSTPSIWIAGMSFSYATGFALAMAGVTIGATLPYFIGSHFRQKIQRWLARYPKQASVLRLAGEGGWFHQFQAVLLIRISPFPYILFNYAIVATDVKFSPYLLATVVGLVPDVLLTLYRCDGGSSQGPLAAMTSGLYAKGQLEEQRRKEELTLG